MFEQRHHRSPGAGGTELADAARVAMPTSAHDGAPEADILAERHHTLIQYLKDERNRQAENRYQMAKDEDYFDGLQWEPEDAQALIDRGQAPLVFNRVKPTIEWVLGTEKRTRIDFKVLPRERDDEDGANVKTKVLKYVGDVNRVQFHRSAAFQEAVVAGLGWLEDGITRDPDADLLFSGHESWRNIYRDSRSREFDLSDARYLFRQRTVDRDIAKAMFPNATTHLDELDSDEDGLNDDDDIWYLGERLTNSIEAASRVTFGERGAVVSTAHVDTGRRAIVRLLEFWYRVPEPVEFFASGPFSGRPVNRADPLHVQALRARATTYNHVAMRMRCMIATESAPLWDGPSPYRHNRFPFTPIWCYRRKRDGEPYGIVRGIRDIQDDFNKRRSKALYILSTNRVVADDDAVDDPEQLRREAARPDGVILKRPGRELRFEKPTTEIQGNFELMQQDESLLQDVSGIQSELMGRQTNATSGKAILARQEQGSMVTAGVFDNLRLAIQLQGEKQLSLVEQFYSEPRLLRIVGTRQPIEWLPLNQFDESTGRVLNDITARQADFIVSEQDYRSSVQHAAAEALADVLAKIGAVAPQVVMNLLDLWVDLLDIPNKQEFVTRVRQMNGQRDPTRNMTPEELAAERAKQEAAAEAQELQRRMLIAQLAALEAKGDGAKAQAMATRVRAMLDAIKAGGGVVAAPTLAPVADEIMAGAGYEDQRGADPNLLQPDQPAQAAVPAATGGQFAAQPPAA